MPELANPKLRDVPPPGRPAGVSSLPYAELDVKTNFSFLAGASHPDELVYRAAEMGYRAIAITDFNSLAGVVRAHEAAKESGLHLLIGTRLRLTDAPDLLVWTPDRKAYARLCRLLTLGKRRAEKGECALSLADFLEESEGMLAAIVEGSERSQIETSAPDSRITGVPPVPFKKEHERAATRLNSPKSHATSILNSLQRHDTGETPVIRDSSSFIIHHPDFPQYFSILKDALNDRLSLAVSCAYGPDDATRLARAAELSRHFGIPLLATNDVYYHDLNRRVLQDVLTCIRHGCTIREAGFKLFANGERHLKSPAQMHRLFADYPEVIRRGLEIAQRCTFKLDELRYEYPDELTTPGKTATQHLADLAWAGAKTRYPIGVPEKVARLLKHELALIAQLRFEHYFLTVYDLVVFARSRKILCQGRGSAANSAVCYCLGITSVDPDKIDLLFERFMSAARGEPPDIDVDFEHERREEVLQYLYEKYGRDRAAMTAEVITYRGRSAIRDVGKAMGLSLDMVDSLAGKLDWWHKGVVSDEQIRETGLDPADRTLRQVMAVATELLGFPRHLSQHVGGMVMTRGRLCEMVPIENATMPDRTMIEWDKDDIDALGILKVDVLALGMLTCISKAFSLIEQNKCRVQSEECRMEADRVAVGPKVHSSNIAQDKETAKTQRRKENAKEDEEGIQEQQSNKIPSLRPLCAFAPLRFPSDAPSHDQVSLELHTVPSEDPLVYDMLSNADSVGVFQVESRAQMSMLPRLRPRCFYDLVIEVAIVRPGPIQGDMVHPYLRRRAGMEPVTFPSEALQNVLEKTLGVPLFQEQAMRVAMVGAGFSADEADKLRRVMAAWRRTGAIETFHEKIVTGMLKNGYTRAFAEQCFNQIKGFGEYGFPESHAASFALLVYVSAWLKRHHPAAFAAALINSQPMGFYMPAQIVRDAKEHGVIVREVDVNASDWDCTLEGTGEREPDAEGCGDHDPNLREIAPSEWGKNGPILRLGLRQLKGFREQHAGLISAARKRAGRFTSIAQFHRLTGLPVSALRILAEADAFGSLGVGRRDALWQVMKLKDDYYPLFDGLEPVEAKVELPKMPLGQEVMTDYATAGLSLKRHPLSLMRDELRKRKIITAAELSQMEHNRWVKVAGLVLIRQRPGTASGVVFETLEDETGVVNLIVHPKIYDQYRSAARHARLLQADGYVQRQGLVIHVLPKRLIDLSELLEGYQMKSRDFH
ncbi:MAG TPA: error-prone DNA polymerase [Tepidisphaeraceae bacterium]|jgi:error-prone DNA polymerase|nr:error-prone DNA polymerase [Tepidisphaeraceae bacterium]